MGHIVVDADRRGEGDEFVPVLRREGSVGTGDHVPVDGISIGEPAVLLEQLCTFQGFQDAACDEGVDRFDEFVMPRWIGEEVDSAFFEGALDLGEVDALVPVLEHDGSDQPSMVLSGTIYVTLYMPFDHVFRASIKYFRNLP